MQRIAIDMDEVIADTLVKFLDVCNQHLGIQVTRHELQGRNLWDIIGREHLPVLRRHVDESTFFANLDVMPDSPEVIEKLTARYEVFISSSAMEVPSSFNAKYDWLKRHFPFIPNSHIVFCGDKGILNTDFLIDDNASHFRRFRGEGILFSAPHNQHVEGHRRVANWREVETLFL